MGFIIRGCIWDTPILIFAYVLFWSPILHKPTIQHKGVKVSKHPLPLSLALGLLRHGLSDLLVR